MILTTDTREITRSGNIKDNHFSVKSTGKAFKILSSSLYKNKVKAIIRELSCNAYDAHVMVNERDKPFVVHLPNAMEPFFSVRDFGPGLSEEDVYSIYTTYFESTKTQSNDYVGALGLGSKSPFSYVDSYTVTSRYKGFKSVYSLYMNEQDCPVVSKLGRELPTKEPDGLEVNVPVKVSDINTFKKEAIEVYSYFKVLPTIKGVYDFKVKSRKVALEGGFFRVLDDRTSTSNVIMGNIAYPVYVSNFSSYIKSSHDIKAGINALAVLPIEIELPVGSVDFTAGREDLSYDEKVTIPKLIEIYTEIYKCYSDLLSKSLEGIETEFEARRKYEELRNSNVGNVRFVNMSLKWKGIDIANSLMKFSVSSNFDVKNMYRYATSMVYEDQINKTFTVSLNARAKTNFWINDVRSGGEKWLRNHISTLQSRNSDDTFLISCSDDKELEKFLSHFPASIVNYISKVRIPDAPVVRKKTKMKILGPDGKMSGTLKDCTEVEVDLEKGGIYTLSYGLSLKNELLEGEIDKVMSSLIKLIDNKDVYVVPHSLSDKIVGVPKWIRLEEIAKVELCKKIDKYDINELHYARDLKTAGSKTEELINLFKNHKIHGKNSLTSLANEVIRINNLKSDANFILPLVNAYKVEYTVNDMTKYSNNITDLYNKVISDYPLIELLKTANHSLAADYVNMCDNYRKLTIS